MSRASVGHDFLAFYTAGSLVRTGRSAELYDLPAVQAFQRDLVQRQAVELIRPDDFGPFWNPPVFAWVFVPLSALTYEQAWALWVGMNLCFAGGAVLVLCRMLRGEADATSSRCDWRTLGLVPLLILISMPFMQAIGHAQNTPLSLLLLCMTVALWRRERAVLAGVVAGLLFYKPQLGAVLAASLIISLGWRALVGLAITGAALLSVTLMSLPGTLTSFVHRLGPNIAFMQIERPYHWERHVTLKALWRLLLQGHEIGPLWNVTTIVWLASATVLAAALLVVAIRLRRAGDAFSRDRMIALTIVAMPLLMPFYFDYDLLLLAVPAALAAREQIIRGRVDRPLTAAWCVLFVWMMVNSPMAGMTRVNGTVIALAVIAAMMIVKAMRPVAAAVPLDADAREPLRTAA